MAPKRVRSGAHVDGAAVPADAKRMQRLLDSTDVKRYEPNVAQQLLEFMHRTIAERLEDAVPYAEHAGRTELTVEDTRLAAKMTAGNGEMRRRPLPSLLREMAAVCNRRNLPEQRKQKQLPPPRDTFIHDGRLRNWQVVVPHRTLRQPLPTYTPAAPQPAPSQGRSVPAIQIRLGTPRPPPGEAPPETLNLQDVLGLLNEPAAVDYDDDAEWEEAQET
ncbi:transcription initiation factor IID, 31kD subunit-domain-containing protein [Pavlovales sp. CCMP2436]|nr:transcription initiation factor IID, 31kD subunit-domain-containing protein [Pavlovales sp. CCMP2436]|mmetsp:Transcript_34354/g.85630  ORF Transcript_34354/g.85630 Transcript_34354/m.85630 type:complete len:218 (-) Transcript_34354:24-677(-)